MSRFEVGKDRLTDDKDNPVEPVITTRDGHRIRITDIQSNDGFSHKPNTADEPLLIEIDEDDRPAFVPGR